MKNIDYNIIPAVIDHVCMDTRDRDYQILIVVIIFLEFLVRIYT